MASSVQKLVSGTHQTDWRLFGCLIRSCYRRPHRFRSCYRIFDRTFLYSVWLMVRHEADDCTLASNRMHLDPLSQFPALQKYGVSFSYSGILNDLLSWLRETNRRLCIVLSALWSAPQDWNSADSNGLPTMGVNSFIRCWAFGFAGNRVRAIWGMGSRYGSRS